MRYVFIIVICYKVMHVSNKYQLVVKSHHYKITFSQFDLFFLQETVGEQQAESVWNSNGRAGPTL